MAGLEAVEVGGLTELELLEVGVDVVDLDLRVGGFQRGKAREGLGSIRIAVLLDQEIGQLRVDVSDDSTNGRAE